MYGEMGMPQDFEKLQNIMPMELGVLPQDFEKADELLLRAGKLGCAKAYFNLGFT